MNDKDLYWLAGIIEGEGCYTWLKRVYKPQVMISMTDEDVVRRCAEIMGTSCVKTHPPSIKKRGFKPQWHAKVTGQRAIYLMEVLYPIMGERRRARMDELYEMYDARPNKRPTRLIESPYKK